MPPTAFRAEGREGATQERLDQAEQAAQPDVGRVVDPRAVAMRSKRMSSTAATPEPGADEHDPGRWLEDGDPVVHRRDRPPRRTPRRKREPRPTGPHRGARPSATPGSQTWPSWRSRRRRRRCRRWAGSVSIRSVSVVMRASRGGVEWMGSGDGGLRRAGHRDDAVPQATAIGRRQPGHGQPVERARAAVEPERTGRRVGRAGVGRQPDQRVRAFARASGAAVPSAGRSRAAPPTGRACRPSPGASSRTGSRPAPSRRAHSRMRRDLGALGPGVGARPVIGAGADWRSSRSSAWAYCPPEVTAMTREPGGSGEERQQGADQGERPDDQRRRASPRCRPGRSSAPGRWRRRCR